MNATTRSGSAPVPFVAYDVCLAVVTGLSPALALVRRHDAALAKQGTNAITSVLLNLAEGNGRTGGDRLHHFRIALGSLREANAVIDIAGAFGWVPLPAPMHAERDRLGGLIYGLLRGR